MAEISYERNPEHKNMKASSNTPIQENKNGAHKANEKTEMKHDHKEGEAHGHSEAKHEHKTTEHKEEKKSVKNIPKKDVAVARGHGLHMSKRHGMYVCAFIRGKTIDNALADLEQVKLFKRAIPFKGEIPHRKGKGMMSGRYPISAISLFIPMLKTLKGNIIVNGMDANKARITTASANLAPRPRRRGGEKGKRAYIILEAREPTEHSKTKKGEKK
ncbi:MAG: uL22 family ribosomal protein [Candidatus Pacearchaeota archaeon]